VYLPELYEFLHDEEIFIRIEAIEAISHVVDEIDVKTVEKELIPPLLKMLTLGVHDEIDLRFSKMFGSIVFSLVKLELHLKYKEKLFSYYRQLLDHPNDEIRINAAFNLPCFNSIYNRRKFSDKKI
jgi:HEAT repeat protein